MKADTPGLLTPSILVIDDEQQIHSSLRLRLSGDYQLVCLSSPQEALSIIPRRQFDLCITDVHMPGMDGLEFVETARKLDPALGYVVLSGYDSDENLRRAIPLQIFDFIPKPLPNRSGFEDLIPDWIARTRRRRNDQELAQNSETIVQDLELARIERDVESTASESAREALLQTSNLLSTIQALLLSANYALEPLPRADQRITAVLRTIQEARRNAEAAGAIAEGYFSSAYADRETSPAVIDGCLQHAVGISLRLAKAEERRQSVDLAPIGRALTTSNLTGIEFLLMLVPVLTQVLSLATVGTTVQVKCTELTRLDGVFIDVRLRSYLWVNRRNATGSTPGVMISIRASIDALEEETATSWLRGNTSPALRIPSGGLVQGIQKVRGFLGIAVAPKTERFEIILALPV